MKTILTGLPLAMLALTGCAATLHTEASATRLLAGEARACFTLDSGVTVSTQVGRCPDEAAVEAEVERLLSRTGAAPRALSGARVVLTDAWIECAGAMTFGCTHGDDSLVRYPERPSGRLVRPTGTLLDRSELQWERVYDWRTTLVHELGHVLRDRARLSPDGIHRDEHWWRIVESRTRTKPGFRDGDPRAAAVASIGANRNYDGLRHATASAK